MSYERDGYDPYLHRPKDDVFRETLVSLIERVEEIASWCHEDSGSDYDMRSNSPKDQLRWLKPQLEAMELP